jgi:hypothetical protein
MQRLVRYASLRLDELEAINVYRTLGIIESHVATAADRLRDLWKDLNHLADEFQAQDAGDYVFETFGSGRSADFDNRRGENILAPYRALMIEQLDNEIHNSFFHGEHRLRNVFSQTSHARDDFINELRRRARSIIRRNLKAINLGQLYEQLKSNEVSAIESPLRDSVQHATPELLEAGGAKRLFLVTPKNVASTALANELSRVTGDNISVIFDSEADVVVCCEAEQLPLDRILTRFIRRRPDCVELASRLHTRVDIDWPTH